MSSTRHTAKLDFSLPGRIIYAIAMVGFGVIAWCLSISCIRCNRCRLRSPWWIRSFESLALGGAALIVAGSLRIENRPPRGDRRGV